MIAATWKRVNAQLMTYTTRWLPFADAASEDLPLGQLLRLSLFQVSVGMATVMLLGTLNRVMIVELSVPAIVVASMIALPVLIAPFRAVLGFRSDTYRSALGWKRSPKSWPARTDGTTTSAATPALWVVVPPIRQPG